jgi:CheY-like chemotaxis protein
MGKSIMIIETDQSFQDLYANMLEGTDYEIIRAYDGIEVWEKLDRKKPDLIILDVLLNMITGDTLFLCLRSMPEYEDIPIIIASSLPKRNYRNLMKVDPNLVFLDKTVVTNGRLITEIKAKIE